MSRNDRIFCFEAFDVTDPLVRAAERLYLATQHPDERIPWGWIARSLKGRVGWRPGGGGGKHLLVATPEGKATDPDALAGFLYGTHLPGFGGYICYLGVDERFRRRGVGTRLFDQAFKVLAADAGAADEPLPFVVWESRKPGPGATEADWKLWDARVKLFGRVGGLWAEGVELHTPNYTTPGAPPVTLQVFVKPVDVPAGQFDAERIKGVVGGLMAGVYRLSPTDPLWAASLPPGCTPRLRPAAEAGRTKRDLVAVG
jgi:GNAT superfamily N-acetyltransferase